MFIGLKKIKDSVIKKNVVTVEYEDGSKEVLSKMMYDNVVSKESYDLTTLRDKRINPVVKEVLIIMRNYGIKINELPYFSAVLNESLNKSEQEALKELWRPWIPTIQEIDDVDLIAIDRVLKTKKEELIPTPYLKDGDK